MIITAQQVALMDQHAERKFVKRVCDYVSEEFPERANEQNLLRACEYLIAKARTFGYMSELDVVMFVTCGFVFGLNFTEVEHSPLRQILYDRTLSPDEKINQLAAKIDETESPATGDNDG